MKKVLALFSAFVLAFTLAACDTTGTDPDEPVVTTVTLNGLQDLEIEVGDAIDLVTGITAVGSDGVDYSDVINIDSDDCVVTDNSISTETPGTCTITYTAVVGGKLTRESITVTIKPEEVGPVEGPIVAEWDFEDASDLDGWTKYENNGGTVTESIEDGALKLVTTSGGNVYETRLEFMGLAFESGNAYEISFKAKSDIAGKGIHFQVGELIPQDPWFYDFKPGITNDFKLSTEWQTFTFSFVYVKGDDSGMGGPLLEMGNFENADEGISSIGLDATIWIDDLVIKGGSGEDIVDPVISGADDVTLFIGDVTEFDPLAGVTASDFPDVDLTSEIILSGDTVDVTTEGTYMIYYVVFDEALNQERVRRIVTVMEDTEAPMVAGIDDVLLQVGTDFDPLAGVTATDNRDGDVTDDIVLNLNGFDKDVVGVYNIEYTVTDEKGNTETYTREVDVTDMVWLPTDLMPNGGFDFNPWYVWFADWNSTALTYDLEGGAAVLDIANSGVENWNIQLVQEGLELVENMTYRLTFNAMTTVDRDINVKVIAADGTEYTDNVSITMTDTVYTFDFTFAQATSAAKISIELGGAQNGINAADASVVTIDNVMLEETDAIDGNLVADTNQVESSDFSANSLQGWTKWSRDWDPVINSTLEVVDGVGVFTYDGVGDAHWQNQFNFENIPFVVGEMYRVTFDAKSDVERGMTVTIYDGSQDFRSEVLTIGTEFDSFTHTFTYTGAANPKLSFELGAQGENTPGSVFYLDNVVIEVLEQDGDETPAEAAWEDFGIAVAETETNVTLTYTDTPANWWEANAQYKNLVFDGNYDAVDFTFTGTAGHVYLFKVEGPEGFNEVEVTADGTEQVLQVPLNNLTKEQRDAINVIIFFNKTEAVSGTAVVSFEAVMLPAMDPVWNGYGGNTLVDNGDGTVTVTYSVTTEWWWDFNVQHENIVFDGAHDAIDFVFTGEVGHDYLFKVEGPGGVAKEGNLVGDGTEQTYRLDLTGLTVEQRASINKIIVFTRTTAEIPNPAGSITVGYTPLTLPVMDPVWTDFGIAVAETETDVTFTYDGITANWWEKNAQYKNLVFDGMYDAVEFTFTGTAGHLYLFKVEGPGGIFNEVGIAADGTEQTLVVPLDQFTEAQRDTLNLFIFFCQTDGASGTATVSFELINLP